MTRHLEFTVIGKPKPKERPRLRVFKTKTGLFKGASTYTPKNTVSYESLIREAATQAMADNSLKMLEGCVRITVRAFWEWPKSKFRKRNPREEAPYTGMPDADNVLKIICDSINGSVYKDDKQVTQAAVEKKRAKQGDDARVVVKIWSLDDEWD